MENDSTPDKPPEITLHGGQSEITPVMDEAAKLADKDHQPPRSASPESPSMRAAQDEAMVAGDHGDDSLFLPEVDLVRADGLPLLTQSCSAHEGPVLHQAEQDSNAKPLQFTPKAASEQSSSGAEKQNDTTEDIQLAADRQTIGDSIAVTPTEVEDVVITSTAPARPSTKKTDDSGTPTTDTKQTIKHSPIRSDSVRGKAQKAPITSTPSKVKKRASEEFVEIDDIPVPNKRRYAETKSTRKKAVKIQAISKPIDLDQTESEADDEQFGAMAKSIDTDTGDKFPRFSSGDTYIHIGDGYTYKLHSTILVRVSPFFKRIFKESIAETVVSVAKDLQKLRKVKYRIELSLCANGQWRFGRAVCMKSITLSYTEL